MEIKIRFGINYEIKRVKKAIANLDWYNAQGYRIRLPNGISSKSSLKKIKYQIIKEYNEKKYVKIADTIKSNFSRKKISLSKKIINIFCKKPPKTFVINLTNYGVGGSYHLPNLITLNINNKKCFNIVIHEIIHLLIEDQIQKKRVEHWEKERIVDLILNSNQFRFLKHNSWQNNYHGAEKYIDNLFYRSFFKNPKDFFAKIKIARDSMFLS